MQKLLSLALMLSLVAACSSHQKERVPEETENEDIEKDYLVRDASSKVRPGWIEDPEVWANVHGRNMKETRFFAYETEPKVSRAIACNIAKANARADIAGEIATFIDKQLATSTEGNASIDENNPHVRGLQEYVQNTLAEQIQALIHGAAVEKTYWEKRKYKKDMGAKRDFTAYTCAVFIRIPQTRLARAIDEAADHVSAQVSDPETKETVKKALEKASENFVKAKTGQL